VTIRVECMQAPGDVELVERKGLGHPDTICDALAEEFSRALSRHYLAQFGTILHHNVDKALLVGGSSRSAFGGGEVIEPMEIHLAGRAVSEVGGVEIPVEELARQACDGWLRENLFALDPARHVRVFVHVRRGSADLRELFDRQRGRGLPVANDTSFGVGFAPLSALEELVLELERELNSEARRRRDPCGGEDVKVMARRAGGEVELTVARAFVDGHLADLESYLQAKARVESRARELARARGIDARVVVNASDAPELGSLYSTVTGTSAESGDDGQVGRGNRVNGLITPHRPMSLEAAAGKNPVSHVGKLYNLTALLAARRIVSELDARHAEVYLVSCIGRPVNEPELVHVRVVLDEPARASELGSTFVELVHDELARIPELAPRLLAGELGVW